MILKPFFISLLLLLLCMSNSYAVVAGDKAKGSGTENGKIDEILKHTEEAEYNAGEVILEHVVDAYEWHILNYTDSKGEKHHISIPLPVILYQDGKFVIFWSSEFEHGHSTYKGFKIALEGENKGKVIKALERELLDEGNTTDAVTEASLPVDLSITKNVLSLFISVILLSWIFISVANSYKRRKGKAPKGLQSFLEPLIIFIRDDVAKSSIGEKKYEKYLPYLLTIFFFIFFNNLFGLVPFFPGGANLTGNVAVTGVLAVFTFLITMFSTKKYYWKHVFNTPGVPWWLKLPIPLRAIVEVMGIFTKPFARKPCFKKQG